MDKQNTPIPQGGTFSGFKPDSSICEYPKMPYPAPGYYKKRSDGSYVYIPGVVYR